MACGALHGGLGSDHSGHFVAVCGPSAGDPAAGDPSAGHYVDHAACHCADRAVDRAAGHCADRAVGHCVDHAAVHHLLLASTDGARGYGCPHHDHLAYHGHGCHEVPAHPVGCHGGYLQPVILGQLETFSEQASCFLVSLSRKIQTVHERNTKPNFLGK